MAKNYKKKSLVKFVLLLLIIIILIGIGRYTTVFDFFHPDAAKQLINSFGLFAPIAFMALYIIATVFFLPGTVFTLLGEILFGGILGTVYVVTGATIGATIAFFLSRYLGTDFIEKLLKKKNNF